MSEQPQRDAPQRPQPNIRVRDGGLGRPYQGRPSTIWSSHVTQAIKKDELLRLLLAGHKVKECAARMRLNPKTVHTYIAKEAFQEELRSLSHEVWQRVDDELKMSMISMTERIDEMADRALANIAALMESEDERVALRANQDILDRHPETSKHHKVDNTTTVMVLDPAQLALAAQAAMEIEAKTVEGEP